ncbi:hypothetical protein PGTUg99_015173 [Puccinia graminis f. sp. tritici]|uniref:Uncharacterized protein n=1 Tax=Puccinia graminis f. sp. tritici TaxID=56615 RepID=A0A5B0Q8C7_PUCGR|nr:hypothetical protein PGTUg99_015173 [Puccinia graminis f. sp. tritici]
MPRGRKQPHPGNPAAIASSTSKAATTTSGRSSRNSDLESDSESDVKISRDLPSTAPVRLGDAKTIDLLATPADEAGLVGDEEDIDEKERGAQVGGGVYGALGMASFSLALISSVTVDSLGDRS